MRFRNHVPALFRTNKSRSGSLPVRLSICEFRNDRGSRTSNATQFYPSGATGFASGSDAVCCAPSIRPPFLPQKELYRAGVHRRHARPLPAPNPHHSHLDSVTESSPTSVWVGWRRITGLVLRNESAIRRFDPENSERIDCLKHRPCDGVLLQGSTETNVSEVAVVDRGGDTSTRFDVGSMCGSVIGGSDEVGVGGPGRGVIYWPNFRCLAGTHCERY